VRFLPLVELGFALERRKELRKFAHCFGRAQKEHPLLIQRVVKERDELSLQLWPHVNE
jgi:hypothetical protein